MNLDVSLKGQDWGSVFKSIIEATIDGFPPTLIVLDTDPRKIDNFRDFVMNQPNLLFIKLGIAFSMNMVHQEIFSQLGLKYNPLRKPYLQTKNLVENLLDNANEFTIVIDNCHYFNFDFIYRLTGLILDLSGLARFIFVVPKDYAESWLTIEEDHVGKRAFIALIKCKYEL